MSVDKAKALEESVSRLLKAKLANFPDFGAGDKAALYTARLTGAQVAAILAALDRAPVEVTEEMVERAFHAGYATGGQDALDGRHRSNAAWADQSAALSTPVKEEGDG